jgi:hypothetical protein
MSVTRYGISKIHSEMLPVLWDAIPANRLFAPYLALN